MYYLAPMKGDIKSLRGFLNEKVALYNSQGFIEKDPICIPHSFSKKQDIEIGGFFASTLAWGNRTSIISSSKKLMSWMDNAPHQFIMDHEEADLTGFLKFAHRTFNATDLLYFIFFLKTHYKGHESLEDAFVPAKTYKEENVGEAITYFHNYFFSLEHPPRTKKHIATPERNSACKRINMYLRWMVRNDNKGVDFGIWKKISPAQLICPLDVHVARVAHKLHILPSNKADWKNAVYLTNLLKELNPSDPAVYDFALFGLGMAEKF
jgi:uncharacterized protein (TIGR02757 family)